MLSVFPQRSWLDNSVHEHQSGSGTIYAKLSTEGGIPAFLQVESQFRHVKNPKDLTVSHAIHQSNLSIIRGEKTGVKQEGQTSHNQSRKSSISPHLVLCDSTSTEKPAVWWTWNLSLICWTAPSKTLTRQDMCWITSEGIILLRRG